MVGSTIVTSAARTLPKIFRSDLADPRQRNRFFNGLHAAMRDHRGENLLPICEFGPPDAAQHVAQREPGATVTRQAELAAQAHKIYLSSHNAAACACIYERLDLERRPQLELIVCRVYMATFDGYGLYQFVLTKAVRTGVPGKGGSSLYAASGRCAARFR